MIRFSVVLAALTLLYSCKLDDEAELIERENRLFLNYLEQNNIAVEPTESGLYYIEEVAGTGVSPQIGDFCLVNYRVTLLENERLVYTYDEQEAEDEGIFQSRTLYGSSKLQNGASIVGIDEGLRLMKEGGKARFIFKSDLGHGRVGVGSIPSYSSLIIDMELLEVIVNPGQNEDAKLQDYLTTNSITVDSTSSGLYYVEEEPGLGDTVEQYSKLTLGFKSSLLDGREIFSQDTVSFDYGTINYTITEGLSEGIGYMKQGGIATIIAPYDLTYGAVGKSFFNDDGIGKLPIPPYSAIVYEIKLYKVEDY